MHVLRGPRSAPPLLCLTGGWNALTAPSFHSSTRWLAGSFSLQIFSECARCHVLHAGDWESEDEDQDLV